MQDGAEHHIADLIRDRDMEEIARPSLEEGRWTGRLLARGSEIRQVSNLRLSIELR